VRKANDQHFGLRPGLFGCCQYPLEKITLTY
jgi:hypothetical protein